MRMRRLERRKALALPDALIYLRSVKPRERGLTVVADKGLSVRGLFGLMASVKPGGGEATAAGHLKVGGKVN